MIFTFLEINHNELSVCCLQGVFTLVRALLEYSGHYFWLFYVVYLKGSLLLKVIIGIIMLYICRAILLGIFVSMDSDTLDCFLTQLDILVFALEFDFFKQFTIWYSHALWSVVRVSQHLRSWYHFTINTIHGTTLSTDHANSINLASIYSTWRYVSEKNNNLFLQTVEYSSVAWKQKWWK